MRLQIELTWFEEIFEEYKFEIMKIRQTGGCFVSHLTERDDSESHNYKADSINLTISLTGYLMFK
ncbi:hypothetical protein TKY121773_18110 [Streptococcus pneumoniae]|uniref:hypothetical protein n=1 Tax=Streptococcus pneumoniae TaxID=1313 RepID=UPI001294747C|nr:hypothetical protein [Streptococcus pneumoniae]BDS89237.1 hypothetical protein PC1520_18060 [Streptococcus pneumoniae]BEL25643.1 hypothetical protein TKY121773_18110 [Streptococcus pneumoniae]BEL29816.1 hypothetical protein TKY120829_17360 [Streptococcus pneumoniae]HEX1645175.1 hypothetical protein [Streptococcus pneumoniae]